MPNKQISAVCLRRDEERFLIQAFGAVNYVKTRRY
jgi:hypothetical protein